MTNSDRITVFYNLITIVYDRVFDVVLADNDRKRLSALLGVHNELIHVKQAFSKEVERKEGSDD